MDFFTALAEASAIPAFVAEYDRLTGSSFGRVISANGINRMIDKATGFSADEVGKFAEFFYEIVWTRLPDECFTSEEVAHV